LFLQKGLALSCQRDGFILAQDGGLACRFIHVKKLVITALDRANQRKQPSKGFLNHSDRGSQYASRNYQQRLKKYQIKPSMRRKGDCYDNAVIELFHGILKRELVHLSSFSSRQQALGAVF
jgi:transposase InsO family protein